MGFHGHFLEFLGCSICTFYIRFPWGHLLNSFNQSYVYSVVYMASHDPSTYRFTTGGYVFIYTVLCTAYYMLVSWQCVLIPFLICIPIQLGHRYGPKKSLQNADARYHHVPQDFPTTPRLCRQESYLYSDCPRVSQPRILVYRSGSFILIHSNRLLTSGWWAYSRKPNYVADWTMSLTWGAIIGTTTIIPYFYSMFFIVVLLHRCTRDFER
jgi:delta24(24(1))-sterol reductase